MLFCGCSRLHLNRKTPTLAVLHTHMPYTTALCGLELPELPGIHQVATCLKAPRMLQLQLSGSKLTLAPMRCSGWHARPLAPDKMGLRGFRVEGSNIKLGSKASSNFGRHADSFSDFGCPVPAATILRISSGHSAIRSASASEAVWHNAR